MRTLYLGLRPKLGTYHYPVIRTEACGSIEPALVQWPHFTHLIFTSQTAVHYWPGPWDKEIIAIGPATATALAEKGLQSLVASEATQEGVITLLRSIDGYFLIPRSRRARSALTDDLRTRNVPFLALDLYDTICQRPEPVPNLDDFDEIVFTSPSTVEGFLKIYGALPKGKRIIAIGPITQRAIERNF